jgi:hypothetical protein
LFSDVARKRKYFQHKRPSFLLESDGGIDFAQYEMGRGVLCEFWLVIIVNPSVRSDEFCILDQTHQFVSNFF